MEDLLKMNLQYFAEDPEPEPDGAEEGQEEEQEQEEVKTVTVEEMKRRLANQEEKLKESFKKEINEAEKLRKMNAEQKQEYEQEKKDARIAELEAKLNRNGLEREATSMLSEQGIAANEYDLKVVVGKDAEETQALVENYASRLDELANKKLEEYKRGTTPKSVAGSASGIKPKKKNTRAEIFKGANILKNK